jgi:Tfp pilus assembly protein FimT
MIPREGRRSRGATLLEVLTATAILAIVLAVGVPNLVALRAPYAVSGAAQQIVSDLHLARQRAIARNSRYQVNFDTSANTYTLRRETTSNTFVVDGGVQKLPNGVHISAVSPGNPIFDSRGLLAANLSLTLTMAGARTRTVTTNVLGRSTIN